ncbi:MAG: 4a-hydroxytetrahydrobiopterin dehydratase [Chitinophagales bacterium]|nr:4a-hydroxytetrahydrobiopterin dehydratase [Chitinophagales bacterium]
MNNSNTKGWEEIDGQLYRKFVFRDFSEAFGFMTQVALLAEKADHHPTWHNTYNVLEIWLTTHDEGNVVTGRDRIMAATIDRFFE